MRRVISIATRIKRSKNHFRQIYLAPKSLHVSDSRSRKWRDIYLFKKLRNFTWESTINSVFDDEKNVLWIWYIVCVRPQKPFNWRSSNTLLWHYTNKHNRLTSGELLSNERRGEDGGLMWGGSTSKNRPLHNKYKTPKQFLWIAYLETSELKGSKST